MTAAEVFRRIAAHMLKGVMMHAEMADYYRFLGLNGYATCHEYRLLEERAALRKLGRYYMERCDRLLEPEAPEDPRVIPGSWYQYTRQDVTPGEKRSAVKAGIEMWVSWERETVAFLEEMSRELRDAGSLIEADHIACQAKSTGDELTTAKQVQLDLAAVDYDMQYILDRQPAEEERYRHFARYLGG